MNILAASLRVAGVTVMLAGWMGATAFAQQPSADDQNGARHMQSYREAMSECYRQAIPPFTPGAKQAPVFHNGTTAGDITMKVQKCMAAKNMSTTPALQQPALPDSMQKYRDEIEKGVKKAMAHGQGRVSYNLSKKLQDYPASLEARESSQASESAGTQASGQQSTGEAPPLYVIPPSGNGPATSEGGSQPAPGQLWVTPQSQ